MNAEDLDQLRHGLERLERSVRCVFTSVPDAVPLWVEQLAERAPQPFTVVCIRSAPRAGLAAHLDQAVQVLAEAVLLRHPHLGCSASAQLLDGGAEVAARGLDALEHEGRRVPAPFWRRTLESCRRGQPPRAREYPLTVEAECLASCLDPRRLLLVWVMPDPSASDTKLLSVARAAEWLATSTHASVLVAASPECRGRASLDSISYDALVCEADPTSESRNVAPIRARPADVGADPVAAMDHPVNAGQPHAKSHAPAEPSGPRGESVDERRRRAANGQPRLAMLWPVIGRPHPLSPPERAFADVLAADAELSAKFAWNQVVVTRERSRLIVDLLRTAGELVVEIDGFRHHSSRLAFEQDRQRDWELLVSGYRVLRLPASEVLRDPRRCLEKLRALERHIAGDP